jgi:hypothetical protein
MNTYDTPGLSAHEFMLAIMHDPAVDLGLRIRAADELCRAGLGNIGTIRTLRVVIDAGYVPTAEEWHEVTLLQRIWNSGQTLTSLGYFDSDHSDGRILVDIPVKGHA